MADLLTFLDLQNRVYRWIDEAATSGGSSSTTTTALVKDAINASHRRLCMKRSWPFMQWPRTESITTVANVRSYALKPDARKVLTLWDVTRRLYMPIVPRREWPQAGVDLSRETALPWGALWGSAWPVSVQPTSASAVTIVSNSASDTTVTLQIEGLDASGDLQTETLTATGTTPVTGTATYLYITNVTKIGTWIGTLTLSYGSTTALTLSASANGKAYPTIDFVELPEGGRVFTYTFERTPRTLVNDNDIPHTPYPFSELHVYDTLFDLTTYNTELGLKEQTVWKARYDELLDGLEQSVDTQIVGAQPRLVRDMSEASSTGRVLISGL